MKYIIFIFIFAYANICVAKDFYLPKDPSQVCEREVWPKAIQERHMLPFASHKGDVMCLAEGIFRDGVSDAVRILRKNTIRRIYVISGGGDVNSALDLAEEIRKKKIDVYVGGACYSSCANYIFMAGHHKYVGEWGVVAFHGAPKNPDKDSEEHSVVAWRRHNEFFKKIGVNSSITSEIPCDLLKKKEFIDLSEEAVANHDVFWTYSKKIMEEKFHVSGIGEMWEVSSQKDLRDNEPTSKIFLSTGAACQ